MSIFLSSSNEKSEQLQVWTLQAVGQQILGMAIAYNEKVDLATGKLFDNRSTTLLLLR